jgi:hypothetical protein
METEAKIEWNMLLAKFFALHDHDGAGWAKVSDLETMFCETGDMSITKDQFRELLDQHGVREPNAKISVALFIQLFEHTLE